MLFLVSQNLEHHCWTTSFHFATWCSFWRRTAAGSSGTNVLSICACTGTRNASPQCKGGLGLHDNARLLISASRVEQLSLSEMRRLRETNCGRRTLEGSAPVHCHSIASKKSGDYLVGSATRLT
eukprot:4856772-Amphidinium_carterae.1